MVKDKHKAYKKYRRLRTNESKDDYNRTKQMAIYVTKKARTEFETRIANNIMENSKELRRFALAFIHSHSGATGVFRNAFREFVG